MGQEELLQQLHVDIKVIKAKMEVLGDHEKRIRFLERGAFVAIGVVGIASFLAKLFL